MAIAYFLAQVIGATLGFGLLTLLTPSELLKSDSATGAGFCSTAPRPELTASQVFFLEYFATTVLITLCCASWDPRNAKCQDSIALKFGFAVSVLSITVVSFHQLLLWNLKFRNVNLRVRQPATVWILRERLVLHYWITTGKCTGWVYTHTELTWWSPKVLIKVTKLNFFI